mgnify:CR=1 FL=1
MNPTILWIAVAGVAGFLTGWLLKSIQTWRIKKSLNSSCGFLESERLMKEKLQKENHALQQIHAAKEAALLEKIEHLEHQLRRMDEDILLLQQDNETTEQMMQATQPELHELKRKLIEANNTIARYKSQLQIK